MKRLTKNSFRSPGFTLTEAVIVVIILAALAALAIPGFSIQMKKVKNQEAIQILSAIYASQIDYKREQGYFADDIAQLDVEIDPADIKNFILDGDPDSIVCDSSAQPLAEMTASGEEYALYLLVDDVTDQPRIVCMPCEDSLCQKMGFAPF